MTTSKIRKHQNRATVMRLCGKRWQQEAEVNHNFCVLFGRRFTDGSWTHLSLIAADASIRLLLLQVADTICSIKQLCQLFARQVLHNATRIRRAGSLKIKVAAGKQVMNHYAVSGKMNEKKRMIRGRSFHFILMQPPVG